MFESVELTGTSEEIIAQIRSLIVGGELRPGDRLPTESQMAEELNVSRVSVREALSKLEVKDVVTRQKGSGTYIKKVSPTKILEEVFSFPAKEDKALFKDLLEVRKTVEGRIVELAASKAKEKDFSVMERAISRLEDCLADQRDSPVEAGIAFHLLLAEASYNQIFTKLASNVGEMLKSVREETLAKDHRLKKTIVEHKKILKQIKANKPDKARDEMEKHLRQVEDQISLN